MIVVIVVSVKLNQLTGSASGESGSSDSTANKALGIVSTVLWITWALIGLLPLIIKIIALACTCLCITNKRVIGKAGILSVNTLDYPINKVDNVELNAGIFGNLFHYHTVTVRGGGSSDTQIRFRGISNAQKFKNTITEAIERHADEARKAQAAEIARAMANK